MSADVLIYQGIVQSSIGESIKDYKTGTYRCYPAGALGAEDIPAQPVFPYVMYGDGGSSRVRAVRRMSTTFISLYDVWVYDSPGSYLRIKNIHEAIRASLEGMEGAQAADGTRLTEAVLNSMGLDGYDEVNRQAIKRATYRVVSSIRAIPE